MNKYLDVEEEFVALSEKKIDVLKILTKYFSYWKWFIISIVLFLTIAVIYLFFSLPKYQITSSILFKDDEKGGTSEISIFEEMTGYTRRNNADNEIEMMKKSMIAEDVVREHNLNVSYVLLEPLIPGMGKLFNNPPLRKSAVLFGDELPVIIMLSEEKIIATKDDMVVFKLFAYPDGKCIIKGSYQGDKYSVDASLNDSLVTLPFSDIRLTKGKFFPEEEMVILVTFIKPLSTADSFINSMEIELTSKTSSVADITLTAPNMGLGRFFLSEYINAYNEKGINDQLELAERTSKIIDNHLANLNEDLSGVEDRAQIYKQSQGLTNIGSQADLYNSQLASVGQRRMDVESQYNIASTLLSFVQQMSGHNQLIPANSGIQSPILNSQISTYNDLVLERNRLARIASSSNQSMIDLNNQLNSTFNSVVSGLQNEKNNLEIQLKDINTEYSRNYSKIRAIPQQERIFSDIVRQQNTKEELFLYLLQKKEERYMNMTVVVPSTKFVDNIRVAGVVWPNKMMILLLFFCIGMILPIVIIKLKDILNFKILSKEDFEKLTTIPLLGEVPKDSQMQVVSVKCNSNDSFNEMFRLVRANLLFVIDGKENKVINILSSISGEGKSFISINLAMSLALLDKRVLIIELDIRNPDVSRRLGLNNNQGITLYLSGNLDKEDLIKPSGIHDNISIINSGAIPPNPNELLAKELLDDLIKELKQEYDFIIIDTPPIGLVSDSFLLNRIADVNLYLVRIGLTPKKYVLDADRYFNENRLKKMYFILNSVDLNSVEYRYGFAKKYQYGYK